MVMVGWSFHLTTLSLVQGKLDFAFNEYSVNIISLVTESNRI